MRYMAVDLGLKRLGVAYSAYDGIVTPLNAIIRKNRNQAAAELDALLKEWQADILVMGIPLGGSSEAEMKRRIEHFVNLLEFNGEIVFQDEAGSSLEAKELLKGEMKHIKDGRIDSLAAMIILQRYLGI